MQMRHMAAAAVISAMGLARGATTVEDARSALEPAVFAFFQDEIKDAYPAHVRAYAVVPAEVTAASVRLYCPLRTPLCGENPRCDHPKRQLTNLDLQIGEALWSSSPGVELPKRIDNHVTTKPLTLREGDLVVLSVLVYDKLPARVSRLMPPAGAATQPATAPAAQASAAAATTSPAGRGGGEVAGAFRVVRRQRPADRVALSHQAQTTTIEITTTEGIGSVELVRTVGRLPAQLRVRLVYADGRPLRTLEGFAAVAHEDGRPDAGRKLQRQDVPDSPGKEVLLDVPEDARGLPCISINWVDAYR